MRTRLLLLGTLVVLAGVGCESASVTGGTPQTLPRQVTTTTIPQATDSGALGTVPGSVTAPSPGISVVPGGAKCSYRQEDGWVLPDPECTPGATNPSVTESDIDGTVCRSGWTSTVRPAESYTENLKREQLGAYGAAGSISGYEEDHLIPLELGGSPAEPENLWPEPGASPNPKDDVEYAANRAVCSGRMTLAEAQRDIAADWVAFGRALGVLEGTN